MRNLRYVYIIYIYVYSIAIIYNVCNNNMATIIEINDEMLRLWEELSAIDDINPYDDIHDLPEV